MVLSNEKAQELLTQPSNLIAKGEALRFQDRVRFHGLTVRDKEASAYWPTFKRWVNSFIVAKDKQAAFDAYFPFPVPTTQLVADVHDALMKVFDAMNPQTFIDAADGVEADLLAYLESIGEPDFWPDEAIAALSESPNDLLVIDVRTGATGRPEPVMHRVALDVVVSIELKKDGSCEHLAYRAADGTIVVVDDLDYRVYRKENDNWVLDGDSYRHGLGRCPARLLWDERVPNHAVAVASFFDEALSRLDAYAFWHVAYDLAKLIGAFPITWSTEIQPEGLPDPPKLFTNPDGTPDAGFVGACEPGSALKGSSSAGPGDHYELPFNSQQMVAPVGIVEPDTTGLTFREEDRKAMYDGIVAYLSGSGGESPFMTQQVNEKQVTAGFTGRENVLRYVSRHLSAARSWVMLTIGQLRYGVNRVKRAEHDFGTEFYLQSETELWTGLKTARDAGASQTVLLEKTEAIQAFRLRSGGNPTRSQILMDLEPLREQSITGLQALVMAGVIEQKKLAVKANFTDLIAQLERDFGADITQIGAALPYSTRIDRFTNYLYDNVRTEPVQPAQTTNGGGTNRTTGTETSAAQREPADANSSN